MRNLYDPPTQRELDVFAITERLDEAARVAKAMGRSAAAELYVEAREFIKQLDQECDRLERLLDPPEGESYPMAGG